jgi:hypothetical protein
MFLGYIFGVCYWFYCCGTSLGASSLLHRRPLSFFSSLLLSEESYGQYLKFSYATPKLSYSPSELSYATPKLSYTPSELSYVTPQIMLR